MKTSAGILAAQQRHMTFAAAFVANGMNATQAAVMAGYSKKCAHAQGCRLLKHAEVLTEIDRLKKIAGLEGEASAERTIRELTAVGYHKLEGDEIKASDKVSALDKLMRYHGLYAKDNEQAKAPIAPIQVQVVMIGATK